MINEGIIVSGFYPQGTGCRRGSL